MEEGLDDRTAGVGADSSGLKRSGSPKYNECAKAPRAADPKSGSPLVLLSPEEGGCRLYSPDEDKVYETKSDFEGYRFLANSGKWFLVVDSRSDLHMVHVFSEERIDLPPLESINGGLYKVERAGDNEFNVGLISDSSTFPPSIHTSNYLRGLLWVDDDKNGLDYVVVWQFKQGQFLGFCKKGDSHYRDIPIRVDVRRQFRGLEDVVLKGDSLYSLVTRGSIRHLKLLSARDGFEDVSVVPRIPMASLWMPNCPRGIDEGVKKKVISFGDRLAVTTSGHVLLIYTKAYEEPICGRRSRIFRVFKTELDTDNNNTLVEVESIGDEALFFDLGITVPAHHSLGIEPNSIYFTRNDRFGHKKVSIPCLLDICVYNIATRTIKRFPTPSDFQLKDAQWFLPS